MFDTYEAYNEYKAVVESGDTSSPRYWSARGFYEDTLRMFGWDWQKRAAFAASMLPPHSFNVEGFAA